MTRSHEPEPGRPIHQTGADGALEDRAGAVRTDAGAGQCEEPPGDTDHPALRISYDERLDFLTALLPGEVVDEPFDAELMTAFAWREDVEGETRARAWLFHRASGGPLIGFGVACAFAWDLAGEDPDAAVWATPRFDVPSLALRGATVGEVVLAAQRTLTGSTPDAVEFDLAVQGGHERRPREGRGALARLPGLRRDDRPLRSRLHAGRARPATRGVRASRDVHRDLPPQHVGVGVARPRRP